MLKFTTSMLWRFASVLAAAPLVAACVSGGNACDGWQPIRLKPASAVWLVQNDRPAAEQIVSHDEHGAKTCGWKTAGGF